MAFYFLDFGENLIDRTPRKKKKLIKQSS